MLSNLNSTAVRTTGLPPTRTRCRAGSIVIGAARHFFLGHLALAAAQDGLDPQEHFARTERLGHIIIRAKFEADDAIDLLRFRGQHDDRDVRGRANRS